MLTVEYKSSMTSASLAADGRIHCAVGRSPNLSLLWLSDIAFCWHFSSSCCSCARKEVHVAGASGNLSQILRQRTLHRWAAGT